ncbi:DUF2381 family protein [Hyalangium versicolor]|uniref:DUF2381 family protein n=1 Tax=Hyalangium versicolor TaxID=2861190 RepID=UPI001CCADDFD|nr:DUF2381 family protein [Hyalangium versicolor]
MLRPVTCAWALGGLLVLTEATAQPPVTRGRHVTIAAQAGEPLPEVRVVAGSTTLILLDAPVDKASVQLDTTRIRLVDVGERTLVLEPIVTPAPKERWVLRVRYADRAQPEWAAFALVSQPGEVDLQVTAVRKRQTLASCQASLAEAQARCASTRAEVWVLVDWLAGNSVQAAPFKKDPRVRGWVYRLGTQVFLVLTLTNAAGPEPWTPTAATLCSQTRKPTEVRARAVHARQDPLMPGEWGTIVVEVELPPTPENSVLNLELRDEGGRSLEVEDVEIPLVPGKERAGR